MSEIKVNKVTPKTNCGTTILGESGDTVTISASNVNLVSGSTMTIASGATITNNGTAGGFGATGAVNWDTTPKTGDFTAVSGIGYFVNTTSAAISVTLPLSPSAGTVVGVSDYAGTAGTNNITLLRNGSNIGGTAVDSVVSTTGLAVTLVYVDVTRGWLVTDSGLQGDAPTATYIAATGGTPATCGDYKIHTFTGPGTFCVSAVGNACGSNTVDYLVLAGAGAGGNDNGGGGGAGGFREGYNPGSYTASPLATTALPVSVQGYTMTIGAGGAVTTAATIRNPGSDSSFSTITSTGGGGGGSDSNACGGRPGAPGGSGGGGNQSLSVCGGTGNTPPVSPAQGFDGGAGGGPPRGAGGAGGGATALSPNQYDGSTGATTSISTTPTAYAGGGGAGGSSATGSDSPCGTGKAGSQTLGCTTAGPRSGSVNTGGGGGGGGPTSSYGGSGGSGIVIIRYKFQN